MKKTILVIATALLVGTASAAPGNDYYGTDYSGDDTWGDYYPTSTGTGASGGGSDLNMIESNVESLIRGAYSFDKSKTRGKTSDNDSQLDLVLNYARKIGNRWQIGTRLNYLKDTDTSGDTERYGFQVGGFFNFSDDLMDSYYVSLFTGWEWSNYYGSSTPRDEVWKTTLAGGKRFTLARWDVAHLVYSPELALVSQNSTTGSKGDNLEYSQSIQIRFLQFSLFF